MDHTSPRLMTNSFSLNPSPPNSTLNDPKGFKVDKASQNGTDEITRKLSPLSGRTPLRTMTNSIRCSPFDRPTSMKIRPAQLRETLRVMRQSTSATKSTPPIAPTSTPSTAQPASAPKSSSSKRKNMESSSPAEEHVEAPVRVDESVVFGAKHKIARTPMQKRAPTPAKTEQDKKKQRKTPSCSSGTKDPSPKETAESREIFRATRSLPRTPPTLQQSSDSAPKDKSQDIPCELTEKASPKPTGDYDAEVEESVESAQPAQEDDQASHMDQLTEKNALLGQELDRRTGELHGSLARVRDLEAECMAKQRELTHLSAEMKELLSQNQPSEQDVKELEEIKASGRALTVSLLQLRLEHFQASRELVLERELARKARIAEINAMAQTHVAEESLSGAQRAVECMRDGSQALRVAVHGALAEGLAVVQEGEKELGAARAEASGLKGELSEAREHLEASRSAQAKCEELSVSLERAEETVKDLQQQLKQKETEIATLQARGSEQADAAPKRKPSAAPKRKKAAQKPVAEPVVESPAIHEEPAEEEEEESSAPTLAEDEPIEPAASPADSPVTKRKRASQASTSEAGAVPPPQKRAKPAQAKRTAAVEKNMGMFAAFVDGKNFQIPKLKGRKSVGSVKDRLTAQRK